MFGLTGCAEIHKRLIHCAGSIKLLSASRTIFSSRYRPTTQWRSQGGGGGGTTGGMAPPKLLVVNFPINLRCYVLLGCRVINVILAINIGDSAFFDIAALVRQFGGLRHHQQMESIDRLRRYLFRKKDKSVLFF